MNAQDRELVQAARDHLSRAYAPYSKFSVAAALRASDGSIHCGVNVENVSYGLTLCAERSAVASAVASGRQSFDELVVVSSVGRATPPCGACRQVLHEFAPGLHVRLVASDGSERGFRLSELLPDAFAAPDLE